LIDWSLSDPLAAAVEDDVRDVFEVRDSSVRKIRDGRIVVLFGSFLRSSELVYRTVAPRLRERGMLTLLRQEHGRDVIIAQPAPPAHGRRRGWINLVLLVMTIVSTVMAGAFQQLPEASMSRLDSASGEMDLLWRITAETLNNWPAGVPFMLALLGILGVHELGHYFTARRYGLPVSLPYFIPFPNYLTGTMGAVIRIDGPFESRRALFDVGIAGPLAGLVIAIPVTIAGLAQAELVPMMAGGGIVFQEPILFRVLALWIVGERPPGMDLQMNPLMMAGWWGLLVTAINLLPVSQLDGGHVSYALFGRAHRWVAWGMYLLAVVVTLSNAESMGYILMLGLVLLMGISHPPALDDVTPVGGGRRLLGLVTLAAFFLLITPQPIQFM
jgi:Zn-dependent protease